MRRQTSEKGNLTTANFRRLATSVVAALLSTFVASVLAVGAESAVDGAASALDATSVKVGIDGVYKNGFQTPVVAFWKGDVERVELETLD
ncbi:MAG: hypothetical protein IJ387_12590, partial [Thermoguttaceae bacterium]|nr:hypothetical protein [Thermoguttaceae bacterium]